MTSNLKNSSNSKIFFANLGRYVVEKFRRFCVLAEDELDGLHVASEAGEVQRRPAARIAAEDQLRVLPGKLLQLLEVALLRRLERHLDVGLEV